MVSVHIFCYSDQLTSCAFPFLSSLSCKIQSSPLKTELIFLELLKVDEQLHKGDKYSPVLGGMLFKLAKLLKRSFVGSCCFAKYAKN